MAFLGIGRFASADPLSGEQLKFFQSPLNGGPPGVYPVGDVFPTTTDNPAPFLGHDELSTATTTDGNTYTGTMMADDFLDTNPNPIGHITFWGSYMDSTDPGTIGAGVQKFRISLYSDIPGTAGSPSQPGSLIVSQTVNLGALSPSSGTFTVMPIPPNGGGVAPAGQPGDSGLYEYNAELNWEAKTFPDAYYSSTTGDTVEWLSIVALVPAQPNLQWGWHDRDYGIADPYAAPVFETTNQPYHGGDDAVSGSFSFVSGSGGGVTSDNYSPQNYIPSYDGIYSSKDLAFALYTVPEPATLGLMGVIASVLLMRRKPRIA
jgi:hypothetical protein